MSNQLFSGQGRDINVFAGQRRVSSITGAYTATTSSGGLVRHWLPHRLAALRMALTLAL